MNSQILGLRVASAVFGLIGLGQLTRILLGVPITVGHIYIHRWMSAIAVVVLGTLCLWLWRLACQSAGAKPGAPTAPPAA
jgi:hypothetical protein